VLALLLTVSGVFGVSSYAVTQRRKGVWNSKSRWEQARWHHGPGVAAIAAAGAAGAALGVLAALAVARVIAHTLTQMDLFDMAGIAGGVLVVMAAAVAAAWVPARRAVKVDPMVALRCD